MPRKRPVNNLSAAVLNRYHLIRHDDPSRHELRMKNIQLRHDRLQAERATNLRMELKQLAAHFRHVNPNTQINAIRAQTAGYYRHIHGHAIGKG